eukprot:TRINITY_DN2809_c0_g1_i1.p1 TRINITY_DN2809_c0_g1~~TRINITY_DN2809_c0_g1_i1.p1  ORF type:complete len:559 (-),score=84.27 TRINITY_DN2809_c0_g1_i1:48-1724(-)
MSNRGGSPKSKGRPSSSKPKSPGNDKDRIITTIASQLLHVPWKTQTVFSEKDPFNDQNILEGSLSKANECFGHVVITHVNQFPVDVLHVPTTPPIYDPHPSDLEKSNNWVQFPVSAKAFMSYKWNGSNLIAYKYRDASGGVFVTIRYKTHATLKDLGEFVKPLSSTLKALGLKPGEDLKNLNIGWIKLLLSSEDISAISLELAGSDEPHLVCHDFAIKLIPLMVIKTTGRVVPYELYYPDDPDIKVLANTPIIITEPTIHRSFGPIAFDRDAVINEANNFKAKALEINEKFRKEKNLKLGLYFNYFRVEGRVLYLLNEANEAISTFKIKPKDIAPAHWEVFDNLLQGKAYEALYKVYASGRKVKEETIKNEIDIDARGWNKFSKDIMAFVQDIPNTFEIDTTCPPKQRVLLLVGLPGSGKSTLANKLAEFGWFRVNQDELGHRKACENSTIQALKSGKSVIIDRCNFDYSQRSTWIKLSAKQNVKHISCIYLDIPPSLCKDRLSGRTDHPTIKEASVGHAVIDKFQDLLIPPSKFEGFVNVITVKTEQESNDVVSQLK